MFNLYVSFEEILTDDFFRNAQVLCGRNGLNHKVKQISVFDCLYHRNLVEKGILQAGDLFISCFDQFSDTSERREGDLFDFFDGLINSKCAGLIILSKDGRRKVSPEIISICDANDFPIVYLPSTVSYSLVMNTINQYISIDNYNAFNRMKLDEILRGNQNTEESLELLYSIKPSVCLYIQAISVTGEFYSAFSRNELYITMLHQSGDICTIDSNHVNLIISAEEQKKLSQKSNATIDFIKNYININYVGFSNICHRSEIREALNTCNIALQTAITMNIEAQTYDPLSSMQLLLAMKNSTAAVNFYKRYVQTIQCHVSSGSVSEMLRTVEAFVACSGDYQATAQILNQHINTIRYRINKVKEALNMENDLIKFYETIAIGSKLRTILNIEL